MHNGPFSVIGTGTILQAYGYFNDCSINEKPQVVDEFELFWGHGKQLPFQAMLRTQARDCLLLYGDGLGLLAEGLLVARAGLLVWVWVLLGGVATVGAGGVCGVDWGCEGCWSRCRCFSY